LKAGQKDEITLQLDKNDLFFFNEKGEKLLEEGEFSILIENESQSFYLKK